MENEERFFREIEDTLHAHEDAYQPGAWESFKKERKRRPAVLWLALSGAAAILLIFLMIQLFTKGPVAGDNNLAGVKKYQPKKEQPAITGPGHAVASKQDSLSITTTPGAPNGDAIIAQKSTRGGVDDHTGQPANNTAKPIPKTGTGNFYPDSAATLATISTTKKADGIRQPEKAVANADSVSDNPVTGGVPGPVIVKAEPKRYTGNSTHSVYDSLVKVKTGETIAKIANTNGRNVSYSVILSPSLGNQKVNFGTGVEVNYKLNKNLYVSSGLAYSNLTANAGGVNGNSLSRRIQGVNLAVSGFELPVGLQYRTGNGFYVSAGVLAMSVLSNRLQYNYINDYTATVSSYSLSGTVQQSIRMVSEVTTEQSNEKINNYLGFYMFSLGKKKTIGKTQLNFGPFLRVPFGGVTSQNIQLMQGGIHLGLDF